MVNLTLDALALPYCIVYIITLNVKLCGAANRDIYRHGCNIFLIARH